MSDAFVEAIRHHLMPGLDIEVSRLTIAADFWVETNGSGVLFTFSDANGFHSGGVRDNAIPTLIKFLRERR